MKFLFLPAILAVSFLFSCTNGKQQSTQTDTDTAAKDTVMIAEIDAFLTSLIDTIQARGAQPLVTPLEFNGETREMSYYDLPNGMQEWDAKVSTQGNESYATVYLQNEVPRLFRFREWDMTNTKTAQEIFMYFKDGEIFYAKDRRTEPGSEMNPSHLLQMPHFDSKMTMEELKGILDRYYPTMRKAWEGRKQ